MKNDSDFDTEAFLREHFEESELRGCLEHPSYRQHLLNRSCGDQVTLDLLIEDNKIQDATFEAQGCMISQTVASVLAKFIQRQSVEQLRQFDAQSMLKQIRITLPPRRMQYGLLAFQAVRQILVSFDEPQLKLTENRTSQGSSSPSNVYLKPLLQLRFLAQFKEQISRSIAILSTNIYTLFHESPRKGDISLFPILSKHTMPLTLTNKLTLLNFN